ncbi:MAG: HEAT repeat domain-containing protein [Verrucomicrobiales bacterium]
MPLFFFLLLAFSLLSHGGERLARENLALWKGHDEVEKKFASGPKELAQARQKDLLKRGAAGPWRRFSDDLLSFEVPDDPRLLVKSSPWEERGELRTSGSAVGTTDWHHVRAYQVSFEGLALGLILVSESEWLDEGGCFCGQVWKRHVYEDEGNFIELQQLESGAVKKIQVLNGKHRAVVFEWTHSLWRQDAYLRLGSSLRFHEKSERGEADWLAEWRRRSGGKRAFPWLRLGMNEAEITALLGEPKKKEGGKWHYERVETSGDGSRARMRHVLPVSGGRLAKLDVNWRSWEEIAPLEGSTEWARQKGEELKKLSEEERAGYSAQEAARVIGLVLDNAGKSEGYMWETWCRLIVGLAGMEQRDERLTELILRRLEEEDLPQAEALEVLKAYGQDGVYRRELVKRLRGLLRDADLRQRWDELERLLLWAEADDMELTVFLQQAWESGEAGLRGLSLRFADHLDEEKALEWVRTGLASTEGEERAGAVTQLALLPEAEARVQLKRLLRDQVVEVRREGAKMARRIFAAEDREFLQAVRNQEEDFYVQSELQRALRELK